MQCAIAAGRRELEVREGELLAEIGRPGDRWVRGFLEHRVLTLDELGEGRGALFAVHPFLRSIALADFEGAVTEDGAGAALWVRQHRLERAFAAFPPDRVEALATSAFIREEPIGMTAALRTFGRELVDLLARAPSFGRLRELSLHDTGFRYGRHLAPLARLRALRVLRLRGENGLSWEGAAHVVNNLPRIRHFGYEIADRDRAGEDFRPFVEQLEPDRGLTGLALASSNLENVLASIRAFPAALRSLRTLHLTLYGPVPNGGATTAALRALLPALEELHVVDER